MYLYLLSFSRQKREELAQKVAEERTRREEEARQLEAEQAREREEQLRRQEEERARREQEEVERVQKQVQGPGWGGKRVSAARAQDGEKGSPDKQGWMLSAWAQARCGSCAPSESTCSPPANLGNWGQQTKPACL